MKKIFKIKIGGDVKLEQDGRYIYVPAAKFKIQFENGKLNVVLSEGRTGRPKKMGFGKTVEKYIGRPKSRKKFIGKIQNKISDYILFKNRFRANDVMKSLNLAVAGQSYKTIESIAIAHGFVKSKEGRDIVYRKR